MHHSHSSNLKLAVVLTESNIFKYQYFPDHQLKAVLADCDTGSLSQPTCWLVALKYCCLNILCKTLLLESAWMSFLCKTTMSYSRSTAGHTHTFQFLYPLATLLLFLLYTISPISDGNSLILAGEVEALWLLYLLHISLFVASPSLAVFWFKTVVVVSHTIHMFYGCTSPFFWASTPHVWSGNPHVQWSNGSFFS